ncbi:MAG TPA: GNAT family N-acetyltransferase [Candidatus Limnocylindrales bacterium]|jgi:RimJ/RimL family protein N-acetyltransferase|nr:GNAT family N-acetyltransferase [Candidatus Limnocylindrales bacterium]
MPFEEFTIISGGQTGVDRAALDWAIKNGVTHGGWCPLGRKAEDGPIAARYALKETPTEKYVQRTEWNVRDSDATIIMSIKPVLSGGSQKTLDFARKQRKPCLVLAQRARDQDAAMRLHRFVQEHSIKTLHIAGPRASEEPEVGQFVEAVLNDWRDLLAAAPPAVPTLSTPRLVLRPFNPADAPELARLAGMREIANTTIAIPHPYTEADALDWIGRVTEAAAKGTEVAYAVTTDGSLAGGVGLREINPVHSVAELGIWIAAGLWGKGYGTEAAAAVVRFGFEHLQLNRICAHHMLRNPGSGRMLQKVGMTVEGRLRQRVRKWGVFEDVVVLAILREDWLKKSNVPAGRQPSPK